MEVVSNFDYCPDSFDVYNISQAEQSYRTSLRIPIRLVVSSSNISDFADRSRQILFLENGLDGNTVSIIRLSKRKRELFNESLTLVANFSRPHYLYLEDNGRLMSHTLSPVRAT